MDFFAYQERARRNSTRLIALFALALAVIVAAVNLACALVLTLDLARVLAISLATLAVIGISSWVRMGQLRGGGAVIAARAGGIAVPAQTQDPLLRRYRNVAEEMAIAAGIPVPQLFVLPDEPGINAFAAGYSPSDAAVAVTQGALERLGRDELQAVVAHEYAHVLNGDMRLNIQLMGWLFGILMLSIIGRWVIQHAAGLVGGRHARNTLPLVLLAMLAGFAAIAIGSLGVVMGRLIKAALSRERELLADASAVQFTRQHRGLAGALKKIGALQAGSLLVDRAAAEDVSHMLFGEGFAWSRWFATHPPLVQRIARLEPSFSGVQLQVLRRRWLQAPPQGLEEDRRQGLAAGGMPAAELPAAVAAHPARVSAHVANPGSDDYRQAARLLGSLPLRLSDAAHDPQQAPGLMLALLLDRRPDVARHQLEGIGSALGADIGAQVTALQPVTARLHEGLRLPLAAMAFPALRSRPRPALRQLLVAIDAVVHRDHQLDLFPYCLARLLHCQVVQALDPAAHAGFGRRRLAEVGRPLASLLAVLAWYGHPGDEDAARRAYAAGLARLPASCALPWARPVGGVLALDAAWPALDALDPLAKQLVVEAVTATVASDGLVRVAEAELLRLVCGLLHCPLPALLEAGARQ